MTIRRERAIEELYADDAERADALAFGRRIGATRRGFLGGAGLAAATVAVGAAIPFASRMPGGLLPASFAQAQQAAPKGPQLLDFPGKDKNLVLLQEKPLVAETPEHLLDDDTTPIARFFIRNNGLIPDPSASPDAWAFTVDGEVRQSLKLTLGELKKRFKPRTFRMVLECGGNGRSFFSPQARGNQWTNGGAGCAEWTGVPLADVLRAAGLKESARWTAHYGGDPHLSGDTTKESISRGVPIAKALEPHNLLVWAMDGQPLPAIHGGPLRLVIPGWPGSASHKWLTRIWIRDREHDGQGMAGTSYRVAIRPIVPGASAPDSNFRILESMPVRGIITAPMNGARFAAGTREIRLRGAAWAGDREVKFVDVSTDFGATWRRASQSKPRNRYDWVRWKGSVPVSSDGYYELWVRATDSRGVAQPHLAGQWNPQGYGGNPMHRVAVLIG